MKKIPYLLFSFVFLALTTSIWWEMIRFKVRMAFAAGIFCVFVFLMLYFARYFRTKYFWMLLLTSICFLIPGLEVSGSNFSTWIHSAPADLYLPFVCAGLLAYILINRDRKLLYVVLVIAFLFIIYTAYKTTLADTNASRHFAGNAQTINDLYIVAQNLEESVMGYAHIHALPFVMVGLICVFRRGDKIWMKIAAVPVAFVCLYALIKSGYTTATICMGLTIVVSCINAKNRMISLIFLALAFVVFVILVKTGIFLNILEVTVKPLLDPRSNLASKIDEFAAMQTTVNGSEYWNGRSYLYVWSFETFLSHPIFGAGKGSAGGHSYFIDLMADYGLIYFIPYVIYYVMTFKFVYRALPKQVQWYYLSACVSLSLLLLFKAKGLIAQHHIMCLVLPLMLVIRKEDFYQASDLMRRQFRLPPLGFR